MKVYVVSESEDCWECSGGWVEKVFSDKELAEEWIGAEAYRNNMKIEEFIVKE